MCMQLCGGESEYERLLTKWRLQDCTLMVCSDSISKLYDHCVIRKKWEWHALLMLMKRSRGLFMSSNANVRRIRQLKSVVISVVLLQSSIFDVRIFQGIHTYDDEFDQSINCRGWNHPRSFQVGLYQGMIWKLEEGHINYICMTECRGQRSVNRQWSLAWILS